ncbi:MAG: aminopeptidase [Candidatus Rokuibacteriota bacterium]|nr:MAG: aminopeptidase [Candidatus Rokubacteria bacterium]
MADPRLEQYAKLLVERCVDVQPGWQVLVISMPLGRPLVDEVVRQIGRRGAYALVRLGFTHPSQESVWTSEAPEELVGRLPDIDAYQYDTVDSYIVVLADENTRTGLGVSPERSARLGKARMQHLEPFISGEKPWVGCQLPTQAYAQDAGMTLAQFEEFLYGAVLIDWEGLAERMRAIADRFDAASQVRIVGTGTDLTLSLEGRRVEVDALGANLPGGEFFGSPVEDSAAGVIEFSEYPACYRGHVVPGVRLRFEAGRVVDASAAGDEEFLFAMLDADEGARRLGELGIGCNPGIQRHTRNTLFDEKIEGTVHVAIGHGFGFLGGTNESSVHWDMVKDLRRGGQIELDGEVAQESGRWLLDD